ncbi:MAG: hypothetical protein Q8942_19055 [Bacillota bacterium]|nr:hypothetical protein [Bacillota bacterium]
MDKEIKYSRSFLILTQDDEGFGMGKEPTGHVKIEVRDGKGRLTTQVQNLNDKSKKAQYKLYLIRSSQNLFNPICVGIIPIKDGRGELSWDFNANSVDSTGISIDKFNITAVIATESGKRNEPSFPLVAYKGERTIWKNKLKEVLFPKEYDNNQVKNGLNSADLSSKFDVDLTNIQDGYIKLEQINNPVNDNNNYSQKIKDNESTAPENKFFDNNDIENLNGSDIGTINNYEINNSGACNSNQEGTIGDVSGTDVEEESNSNELNEISNNESIKIEESDILKENQEYISNKDINAGISYVENPNTEKINTENSDMNTEKINIGNSNTGDNFESAESKEDEEIENIYSDNNVTYCDFCMKNNFAGLNKVTQSGNVDINKLKELLNKNLEIANPFKNGCRIYKWWKVGNPAVLTNIFYQCNIKNPLIFNPKVLMAYYKFRRLITGICHDISRDREYIVLGVPGNYGIDARPFGAFCRWAQEEGVDPKHGAFGYWLIYLDSGSGKIIG